MRKSSPAVASDLGPLSALGLGSMLEAPLIVPEGYDDLRYPEALFRPLEAFEGVLVQGVIARPPSFGYSRAGRAPRLEVVLRETHSEQACGELTVHLFGVDPERDTQMSQLHDQRTIVFFRGEQITSLGNRLYLRKAERVFSGLVGRVVPRYPGRRGVVRPEQVRDYLLRHAKALAPSAAERLLKTAFPENPGDVDATVDRASLVQLRALVRRQKASSDAKPTWGEVSRWVAGCVKAMHMPASPEEGIRAREVIARLGALCVLQQARRQTADRAPSHFSTPSPWQVRAQALPFELSQSQHEAVEAIAYDLHQPLAMHRVLTGDVGSGKTACYGLSAVSVIDGGGSVAVMLPGDTLATQVYDELLSWWPDIAAVTTLVSGKRRVQPSDGTRLWIGTTALLHQLDLEALSLCIVDEEHKFSVAQRQRLMSRGTGLLEISATPIPRTLALVAYGGSAVSQLESHTHKQIITEVHSPASTKTVFAGVRESLARGERVLVVYPLKNSSKAADARSADLQNLSLGLERWRKACPDATIAAIHSEMDRQQINQTLAAFKAGDLQVLLSTSIVETGLNIPNLMRVVVVNAERHGLSALHQIRGRAARYGGTGYFDLIPSKSAKRHSLERLQVLAETHDGFEVARRDMKLRGAGDLSKTGARQSGATPGVLYGADVHSQYLDEMYAVIEQQ